MYASKLYFIDRLVSVITVNTASPHVLSSISARVFGKYLLLSRIETMIGGRSSQRVVREK